MSKNRQIWVDFAKGISIILVVMGHSGNETIDGYLSWFRMPLFFMLSGYFFKPISQDRYLKWATKQTGRFIVPYVSYGVLIALMKLGSNMDASEFVKDLGRIVYGGQLLEGPYGVFWFITVLLLTQLLFAFLSRFSTAKQITILAGCYLLAHIVSVTAFTKLALPWNADVVLITVVYYSLGHYGRRLAPVLFNSASVLVGSVILSVALINLQAFGIINHVMDLKFKVFTDPILDLAIPIVFTAAICSICFQISKLRFYNPITTLGTMTVTIMYLHMPANYIITKMLHVKYGSLLFTLIGVAMPLVAYFVFQRSQIMSRLFLGKKAEAKVNWKHNRKTVPTHQ